MSYKKFSVAACVLAAGLLLSGCSGPPSSDSTHYLMQPANCTSWSWYGSYGQCHMYTPGYRWYKSPSYKPYKAPSTSLNKTNSFNKSKSPIYKSTVSRPRTTRR